ncbi:hypothetical protein TSH58p_17650 [Azospirillum sp. TSH58]|uniref:phage tail length tape measure family protein n=1 Tax=Azospirillum sp. TSH58 TaxID=664962 RepID=UPI000D601FC0|nr:phage tail length tape measure family protein [Azospirillum sp. TSH58]AWJ85188.1 hypothetical protein TSH58p_17650 [Azospirillum sp. TSH58]PWC72062.1 hypothetical protein TSH58_09030 [Azospirillum sp. TSH58]
MSDIRIAELTVDNKKAMAALGDVAKVMDSVGGGAETNTKRLAGVTREFGALARASGVYVDASDRMARATEQADRALAKKLITETQHARILETARLKYDETAAASAREAKAVEDLTRRLDPAAERTRQLAHDQELLNRALAGQVSGVKLSEERHAELSRRLQETGAATTVAAVGAGRMKGAMGNLGLQLQDVAVQAQMGTSAFTILAQQGPQVASAFGPMGVAIGTVVAVASVAAGVLFKLGDETGKSAKEIDTFGDVLGVFEGRARETGKSVDDLSDRYRALGGELRALSKLALQADLATLTEKRTKDQKAAWDTIRNATMAGVQDAPAALSALQQLGRDKDLTAFLGKLQALNAQGAVKLMRDEDVRALLETGEAIRVAEARMADLEGRATEAQKALLGYAEAAREAAKTSRDLALAEGQAAASLFVQEDDLDAKIKALKGGESAMRAYAQEQVKVTAYKKAFDDAITSGMPILYAQETANRIAAKAVEAYRLEQQRGVDATNRAAAAQAEGAQKVAAAHGVSSAAVREATIQQQAMVEAARSTTESYDAIVVRLRKIDEAQRAVQAAQFRASMRDQAADAERLANAWAKGGAAAAREAALANEVLAEARKRGLDAERDAAQVRSITEDMAGRDLAQRQLRFTQMADEQRQQVEMANAEFQMLGMSNAARAEQIAIIQKMNDLKALGVDMTDAGTDAFITDGEGDDVAVTAIFEEALQ